ncbi:Protein kinase domain-containing protein [Mycena kentingensis (nom. inval.)]|nr:Protein kinase domain-containing protein [Mycena kentingensis (nom. inval.)]
MSAAQHLTDLTGQLRVIVGGEYHLRLLSTLGVGTFGRVYKAVDIHSSLHYAVKCMARAIAGSRQHIAQEREVEAHTLVSGHPRIVTLHHHLTTADHVFLVLEYVAGGTLLSAVQRRVFGNDTPRIKQAMSEILDVVAHLQRHGVAHRDIKPENFLCDADGSNIRLADFGLAEVGWESDSFAGTLPYMSPEAHRPDASLALNDQWAVAVTFLNIVSNSSRCPWQRADLNDAAFYSFCRDTSTLQDLLKVHLTEGASLYLEMCLDPSLDERSTLTEMRKNLKHVQLFTEGRRQSVSTVASVALTYGASAASSRAPATPALEQPRPVLPKSARNKKPSILRRVAARFTALKA